MTFHVDEQVVHPAHGVGRVIALVTRRFAEAEARQYYEVALTRSTVWVPVAAGPGNNLRALTPKDELAHYRDVLRSRPNSLIPDHRQRHLELASRLRPGLFQNLCEVVRDLSARGWVKPLNEKDAGALRKTRDDLCQEWAATSGVSITDAVEEVEALLREGRLIHQP